MEGDGARRQCEIVGGGAAEHGVYGSGRASVSSSRIASSLLNSCSNASTRFEPSLISFSVSGEESSDFVAVLLDVSFIALRSCRELAGSWAGAEPRVESLGGLIPLCSG